MPARDDLIARKAEVQARIRSLRLRLEAAVYCAEAASGVRRKYYSAKRASLEAELEVLMAEESRLRLEIDRAGR